MSQGPEVVLEAVLAHLCAEMDLEAPGKQVTADALLVDHLGLTSLDAVELAMWVEERFGVVVSDFDIPHLLTPRQLSHYVDAAREHGDA